MKNGKTRGKEYKEYKINPSLEVIGTKLWEGKKVIRTIKDRPSTFKAIDTKIYVQEVKRIIQDKEQFYKFFVDGDTLYELLELTITAQKLLVYILTKKLEFNKSSVFVTINTLVDEVDLSRTTVSAGFNELIDREWLYHSDSPFKFWINLTRVTFGSREEIYEKEYGHLRSKF